MKTWKKIVSTVSAVALLGAFSVGLASNNDVQQTTSYRNISLQVNGSTVVPRDASGTAVEPFIINGTTYLPIRGVASALGMGVDWDGTTHTVKLNGTGAATSTLTKDYMTALDIAKNTNELAYKVQMCVMDLYTYISDMNLQLATDADFSPALESDYDILVSQETDLSSEITNFMSYVSSKINSDNSEIYANSAVAMKSVQKAYSLVVDGTQKANALVKAGYVFTDIQNLQNTYASAAYDACTQAHSDASGEYSSRYSEITSKLQK